MKKIVAPLLIALTALSCSTSRIQETVLSNPIIPGYFADPSVVEFEGKYYMYATADPWGTGFLSCWVSDDFRDWTFTRLNWPTKEACSSPLSNGNSVWAPSVVRKGDMFYMYVSVGSEIWAGKASHPLGPWQNMLGDRPLVSFDTTRYTHEIDAEVFVDDDGKSYLYWGSGWGWINGRCWVAELNPDMASFATPRKEITPERYFEGPFMIKQDGTYYLTYSEGKTIEDSYEVRYATGDSPFGPFKQAANSPVLTKNEGLKVFGPGHHTIVKLNGQHYILYHKHRLPFVSGTAYRQISMNPLNFDLTTKQISNIVPEPTVKIPPVGNRKSASVAAKKFTRPVSVTASSSEGSDFQPSNVADEHNGTRWQPSSGDKSPVLTARYARTQQPGTLELRLEYPWQLYYFSVETSVDGISWKSEADYTLSGIEGSPVLVKVSNPFTQIRLKFVRKAGEVEPGVIALRFAARV